MKRKYSKPEIIFEDFALCQSIATGCGYSEGAKPSMYEMGCGVDFNDREENDLVFTTSMNCDMKEDDGDNNLICYHIFDSSGVVFAS